MNAVWSPNTTSTSPFAGRGIFKNYFPPIFFFLKMLLFHFPSLGSPKIIRRDFSASVRVDSMIVCLGVTTTLITLEICCISCLSRKLYKKKMSRQVTSMHRKSHPRPLYVFMMKSFDKSPVVPVSSFINQSYGRLSYGSDHCY